MESRESLNLYGFIRRNEGLAYVLSIGKKNQFLPVIGKVKSNCLIPDGYDLSGTFKDGEIVFHYRENDQWLKAEKDIVDLSDSFKRTPFPQHLMEVLKRSLVVLFGLGSVGSRIALGLARSGIMNFRLIDPDVFAIENASRHECDLLDLGRFKVEAIKERILRVNPLAKVEVFPFDILEKRETVRKKTFINAHLVIATTDRKAVQLRVNYECYKRNLPALFAGCYDEARAGEILYVIPGETVICYECLRGGTKQQEKPREYDYSRARDSQDYEGEPGLNGAINLVSDVAEQYAIAMLLRKEDCEMAKLIDPKRNLLFIGGALGKGFCYLKDTYCFKKPFEFVFPVIKEPWKECGTCQITRKGS